MAWRVAFAVGLVAVCVGGYFSYRSLRSDVKGIRHDLTQTLLHPAAADLHRDVRLWAIRSRLADVTSPVVVMGDSIVERARLPDEIAGHPVVNAGVGGTGIGFFREYAPALLRERTPALVVFLVGINDANSRSDLETFRADYLATLRSIAAPVAVGTITPSNNPAVDGDQARQFNAFIAGLPCHVIDVGRDMNAGMTMDGIHPNGDGYRLWMRAVVVGIERAMTSSTDVRDLQTHFVRRQ